MSLRGRWPVFAAVWTGLTLAVLAVERLPGDYTHALCGPWG
jgi:hypothetical protein